MMNYNINLSSGIQSEFAIGDDVYIDDYYMGEVWAPVKDFEDEYLVSSKGRVWSIRSQMFLTEKKMDREGHTGYCFQRGPYKKYVYLHRIMAEAFIPNPNNYLIVRHLNDIPYDNVLENLAWGTQKDNHDDSVRNGTSYIPTDEDREIGFKKCRKPVIAIDLTTGEEIIFESRALAARVLNLEQANIWKVLNGERRATCGYTFKYPEDDYNG